MQLQKILIENGVADWGYTEDSLPLSRDQFSAWIEAGKAGPLHYLQDTRKDKRDDIKNYWPDFQSALVFLFSYDHGRRQLQHLYKNDSEWNGLKIASYTLGFNGQDYHHIIKERLNKIGTYLREELGTNFQLTLDVHPVLERDLAYKTGLGWFGKNSMMINRNSGSFTLIGSLLLDQKLNLTKNTPDTDHCGQCTLCAEACPTKAIDPVTRTITAVDCISTFTIEQFKLETEVTEAMDLRSGFIFGCDICQDVCPWNKRQERLHSLPVPQWSQQQAMIVNYFLKRPFENILCDLEESSGKQFEKKFRLTSFERSGRRGLLKNLRLYQKQTR